MSNDKMQVFWKGKLVGCYNGRDLPRMLVRVRDNFICQDCGAKKTPRMVNGRNAKIKAGVLKGRTKHFDVHHEGGLCGKKSKGYDRVSKLRKLVTLCHRCHYNRPEHRCQSKAFSNVHKQKKYVSKRA